MGRTMKRVPMDFAWPTNKVWEGYLNPYYDRSKVCVCEGTGRSPGARLFGHQWYGKAPFDPAAYGATPLTIDHPEVQAFAQRNVTRDPGYYGSSKHALVAEAQRLFSHWKHQWCHHLIQADVEALVEANRLHDFCRRPRNEEQAEALKQAGGYWMREHNGYMPTADEVNAWSLRGMGHDAINEMICVQARCNREGIPLECHHCAGEGRVWPNPNDKKMYEEWTEYEPPTGHGYQLWETTSEGSPQSPVFETMDQLCEWCADHATTFGSERTTAAEWRRMLDAGFVCHQEGNNVFL